MFEFLLKKFSGESTLTKVLSMQCAPVIVYFSHITTTIIMVQDIDVTM